MRKKKKFLQSLNYDWKVFNEMCFSTEYTGVWSNLMGGRLLNLHHLSLITHYIGFVLCSDCRKFYPGLILLVHFRRKIGLDQHKSLRSLCQVVVRLLVSDSMAFMIKCSPFITWNFFSKIFAKGATLLNGIRGILGRSSTNMTVAVMFQNLHMFKYFCLIKMLFDVLPTTNWMMVC